MAVDPRRLPIESPVAEISREGDRTRVTFTRLASIYYLEDDHPEHDRILAALEASRASGEPVAVYYALPHKTLTGLAD